MIRVDGDGKITCDEQVADLPVGENLIEHRAMLLQARLKEDISHNRQYSGWRAIWNGIKYYLGVDGLMSAASYEIVGWLKTDPALNRPDAQILVAPFSFNMEDRTQVETVPALLDVAPGSWYVPLDQPLAGLAIAALEPDTPVSYVTQGVIGGGVHAVSRVLARPGFRLGTLP